MVKTIYRVEGLAEPGASPRPALLDNPRGAASATGRTGLLWVLLGLLAVIVVMVVIIAALATSEDDVASVTGGVYSYGTGSPALVSIAQGVA